MGYIGVIYGFGLGVSGLGFRSRVSGFRNGKENGSYCELLGPLIKRFLGIHRV